MTTITPRMDQQITDLFDAIIKHDCLTYEDIEMVGGFDSKAHVAQTLAWVRTPDISEYYGWTVPHVPRGRPSEDQDYRYIVVGTGGSVLSKDDLKIVQTGTLSTARTVKTQTLNLAHALRTSAGMTSDKVFKKWCRQTAMILEGVSTTADLEVDRLVTILATPAPAPAPATP